MSSCWRDVVRHAIDARHRNERLLLAESNADPAARATATPTDTRVGQTQRAHTETGTGTLL